MAGQTHVQPADTVPPMPQPNPPPTPHLVTPEDLRALQTDAAMLRESAQRIENAARTIAHVAVAATSMTRLTRRDKVIVGVTAVGLVGVGVGGTLLVQSIRRGRAARRMNMPAK